MKIKPKITIILGLCLLIASAFPIYQIWQKNLPLISPLELIETLAPITRPSKTDKIIFGFFPYWNMKYSDELNIKHLTHLAYFGIDLNQDGTVKTHDNPQELEPGWNKLGSTSFSILHRQLQLTNKKTILVIRVMTYDQIISILTKPSVTETAINSIMEIVNQKKFDGINLDFEAAAIFDQQTRSQFTSFVEKLNSKCKISNIKCEMSIDIFADSAIKNRLYDLKNLADKTDYFIVMAYDFYRPSSSQAGPVAPLRGRCSTTQTQKSCLEYDITTSIADITKFIPAPKIILGIPFYGYQWQTVDQNFLSNTYPKTGSLASYKRIQEIKLEPNVSSLSAIWSNQTLSPYLTFIQDGKTFQIHYDNSQSISLKIDLIHQANLAGLAIWALGYELPYQDLWSTISSNI